jgi:hypothetical protein
LIECRRQEGLFLLAFVFEGLCATTPPTTPSVAGGVLDVLGSIRVIRQIRLIRVRNCWCPTRREIPSLRDDP